MNQALSQHAPAYLNVSNQDKLRYGRYTCQALDAGVTLDTMLVDFIQSVAKDVPQELHYQAGAFFGISMAAGVQKLLPKIFTADDELVHKEGK